MVLVVLVMSDMVVQEPPEVVQPSVIFGRLTGCTGTCPGRVGSGRRRERVRVRIMTELRPSAITLFGGRVCWTGLSGGSEGETRRDGAWFVEGRGDSVCRAWRDLTRHHARCGWG